MADEKRPSGNGGDDDSYVLEDTGESIEDLEHEMEALIAEYPDDGFIRESPAKLGRIVNHVRAGLGLQPHTAPRCNAPWVSAVLEANGDLRPCFFHPPIGNTAGTTLSAVLNGPLAIAFRDSLDVAANPVCRRCVCSLYVASAEEAQASCRPAPADRA